MSVAAVLAVLLGVQGAAAQPTATVTPPPGLSRLWPSFRSKALGPVNPLFDVPLMGAFQGKNATGDWKLVVAYTNNNGQTGWLNVFGVEIISLNEVPIMTTTHFSQTTPVILSDQGEFDSQLSVNVPEPRLINARLNTNITHPKPRQLSPAGLCPPNHLGLAAGPTHPGRGAGGTRPANPGASPAGETGC